MMNKYPHHSELKNLLDKVKAFWDGILILDPIFAATKDRKPEAQRNYNKEDSRNKGDRCPPIFPVGSISQVCNTSVL
jgi:hypothetical protein